jgi:hypothetical protein
MIRLIIQYTDGTARQFLPATWAQILQLSHMENVAEMTIFAITPREYQEYQKKINAENIDFMRVSR